MTSKCCRTWWPRRSTPAVQTVDEAASAAMGQLTGGLNIPGLGL